MRKIFISFTGLLQALAANAVTQDDLNDGLFFFGCKREHALNPGGAGEPNELAWGKGSFAAGHPRLVEALLQAETDGRASWYRETSEHTSPWHVLEELLTANGYAAMRLRNGAAGSEGEYGYPEVQRALQEQGIPLTSVF